MAEIPQILEDALQAQRTYWLEKLAGASEPVSVPLDYERPAVASARDGIAVFQLEPQHAVALWKICASNRALMFTLCVAAVKIVLHKYSGSDDITVGTAIHARHAGTAALNKALALRDRISRVVTIRGLLSSVRETIAGAYANQNYPFDRLSNLLGISSPPNCSPLFYVAVAAEVINDLSHIARLKHDITVVLSAAEGHVDGRIEYSRALYKPSTMWLFADHLSLALTALRDPDRTVEDVDLQTAEQSADRLIRFNATADETRPARLVHKIIEEQAARTPDRIAVRHGDADFSYRALDGWANRLCRRLHVDGTFSGKLVGVCLHHCVQEVVAVLAVLKGGGAYVPLDPAHPRGRIQSVVEDAGITHVLTVRSLVPRLPDSCVPVYVEEIECCGDSEEPVIIEGTLRDLAYVLYTSGSTGRPKGVEIEQRSLVSYLLWAAKQYVGDQQVDFALYSSLAFDLTVTSLFLPLITGGTVVVYSGATILEILDDNRVDALKLTPSHLSIIDAVRHGRSRLRQMIVGGEALLSSLARRIQALFGPELQIWNEYGPTEATVGCMIHRFDAAVDDRTCVPIGRPIANTQVYVLDDRGRPVAANMRGELFVAGKGLARGYLGWEDLNRESFIENPFRPGSKMYRTGDIARWLPEGIIEYCGRRDDQLKYHGFRIELNEIRLMLNRHAMVKDSSVAVARDAAGQEALVAYYVARHEIPAQELRRFLSELLLPEVIPNFFVRLPRVPLNLNGKVSTAGLISLEEIRSKAVGHGAAPRTVIEGLLVAIMEGILDRERIGVSDNFFELGGHSLLASQFVSRIRQKIQVDIPLRSVFEHPTVSGLAQLIEQVQGPSSAPPFHRAPRKPAMPASFAQERLWLMEQMEPGGSGYNIPMAVRLRGRLDLGSLQQSFSEVVRRHEALRTRFVSLEGTPLQVVDEFTGISIGVVDLSSLDDDTTRDNEAHRLAECEARQGFDLRQGPLMRVRVVRLQPQEHVLLITLHHIVSDGWSMGILIWEVTEFYRAREEGRSPRLRELEIQYADYAVWQREWLQGEVLEEQLGYWRKQLDGAVELQMPIDHARGKGQSYVGAAVEMEFGEDLSRGVKRLSREQGVTTFMVLLAGFEALLWRYTGQEEIVVGTDVANRNRMEVEGLIGFFVNQLVLRTAVNGARCFEELLQEVRSVALGAYAHQEAPFEKVVEALRPERTGNRQPLFQVKLVLQNAPRREADTSHLQLEAVESAGRALTLLDLIGMFEEREGELGGVLIYNAEVYEAATMRRMAGQWKRMMEAVVAAPGRRVQELPMMSESERRQVTEAWQGKREEWSGGESAVEEFEVRVRERRDAVAVESGEAALSYGELNRRANRLGRYLKKLGVGPEVRVGICLERGVEMVVGVMGVLKAGGAYVPLDARYPEERLYGMCEDAQVAVVVGESRTRGRMPAGVGQWVSLDEDGEEVAEESGEDLPSEVDGENLAYVIYTSGSTGKPKGVMVTHGGLRNLALAQRGVFAAGAQSRVLQFASLSFDASVSEIFVTLCAGGTLCVAQAEDVQPGEPLQKTLQRRRVTEVTLPPAALSALKDCGPGALRTLVVAGEACGEQLAEAWGRKRRLLNGYGPTETGVCATVGEWAEGQWNIGRPLENVQVYVVGKEMELVGVGVWGEIYIGGAGVARGYSGRGDWTAERFVPDGYGGGGRLYRTGDIGRWREDGALEYLGREDGQIKLRGYRIELGEIETVLGEQRGVKQAAVVVKGEREQRRLVGYVSGDGIDIEELKEELRRRLPEYMVPAQWGVLDALPLTPNGKIDRRALPEWTEPKQQKTATGGGESAIEELVGGTWSEVLGREAVGRDESFFDLGGHSLLATQVVTRLEEALGLKVPLQEIFEKRTLRELAEALELRVKQREGVRELPRLERRQRQGGVALSFAQQRLWFVEQMEPGGSGYNIPMAVRLRGRLDLGSLQQSFSEVVRRHEALRTRFVSLEGTPLQVVDEFTGISIGVVDLSSLDDDTTRDNEAHRLAECEARQGFDLRQGPLMRVRVVRLQPQEHVLLITLHHIVSDGWSMGILIWEVTEFYRAREEGRSPRLRELEIQYADYAVWQREWLQGEVLEEQLGYWRKQLDGAVELQMPIDHARGKGQSYRSGTHFFHVDSTLVRAVPKLAQTEAVTLAILCVAVLQLVLHHLTGQTDVTIGADVANRSPRPVEPLIGYFTNQVILRSDLSGDPSFRDFLSRVRRTCLEAYSRQHVPFDRVVEALHPLRDADSHPVFRVKIAFQNTPAPLISIPGLDIEDWYIPLHTTNLDLTMLIGEADHYIQGRIEYRKERFTADAVRGIATSFLHVLRAATSDAGRTLSDYKRDLDRLDAEESDRSQQAREQRNAARLASLRRAEIPSQTAGPVLR